MKNSKTRNLTFTALVTAFICVTAPFTIQLPFASAPITLATFIIYLCGVALGTRLATSGTILYIILGAIGLPVFSKFSSGIGYVAGMTGGYLIGYIPMAFFSGLFSDLSKKTQNTALVVSANVIGIIIGTVACYVMGTIWFCHVTSNPPQSAIAVCVLPYLPLDTVKMILAVTFGLRIRKIYTLAETA